MKVLKHLILISLVLLNSFQLLKAETISEDLYINQTTTWSNQTEPYIIQANVFIGAGAEFLIGPGVTVIFDGDYAFYVKGFMTLGGSFSERVVIKGRDIGNGQHSLWKGIIAQVPEADFNFNYAVINDARNAINLSNIPQPFNWNSFSMSLFECTLENNLNGILTGNGGVAMSIRNSLIANNNYGIKGSLEEPDSLKFLGQVSLVNTRIENNRYGLFQIAGVIHNCTLTSNDTAVWDVAYIKLDSNNFVSNQTAFIGHSASIKENNFLQNTLAVHLTDRKAGRDLYQSISSITFNLFEGNNQAVKIDEGNRFGNMECNLYNQNVSALELPSQVRIGNNESFLLHKNGFFSNTHALVIHPQSGAFTPEPNTLTQPINLQFNTWFANVNILENKSPDDLNLFKNYISLASKTMIEAGLTDGSDSSMYGLVNYTVCGDSSMAMGVLTVNKIEDIIKHNNLDSSDTAGVSFSFNICLKLPGNPLNIEPMQQSLNPQAFPNPTQGMLRVKWEHKERMDLRLYTLQGKEVPLPENQQSSPAEIDLGHLPKGIYLLRIGDGEHYKTLRIQKD